jgi:hypothetical protein
MATRDDDDTVTTVAALGGGALLAWLLVRGGWGLGGGNRARVPSGEAAGQRVAVSPAPAPCQVRIRKRAIELNGTPAGLPTTVNACRAAGRADLSATGDAVVGVIAETARALRAAGVQVSASPELSHYVDDSAAGRA